MEGRSTMLCFYEFLVRGETGAYPGVGAKGLPLTPLPFQPPNLGLNPPLSMSLYYYEQILVFRPLDPDKKILLFHLDGSNPDPVFFRKNGSESGPIETIFSRSYDMI